MPSHVSVLIWTCTLVFVATSVVTFLALIGKLTLGGGTGSKHHTYLRWLFTILIVEIVSVGIYAFASSVQSETELIRDLQTRREVLDSTLAVESSALRAAQVKIDSLSRRPLVVREDTLTRELRVTSSRREETNSIRIPIPQGWEYVSHTHRRISATGENDYRITEEKDAEGRVTAILATGRAEARTVKGLGIRIGGRAWVAIALSVIVREAPL